MNGQRSIRRYRAIDLSLFAFMLIVFETLIVTAATRWFPNEPYTVSLVAAVTAIVMMRWGPWAALHAVLGGLTFCLASHGSWQQAVIYGAGNLPGLAAMLWFRVWSKEQVRADSFKSLLFAFTVLLGMQLGRAALSIVFGSSPAEASGFIATDVVSYLFTLLIVWIARRLDGVFEDQAHYLRRLAREREEERGGV